MVTITTATAERNEPALRVAVTGATGYIGRSLVAALLDAGHHVVALVRDVPRARSHLPRAVEVRPWSLRETGPEDVRGVYVLCHLAAFIPPDMGDPAHAERCVLDNAIATQRLVGAMRAAGIPRLIYFSTGQLYRWKDSSVTEDDAVDPSRRAPYYLGSKLLGEIFCRHAGEAKALDVTVLRLGSVYGPHMPATSTMQRMVNDAAAGKALSVADGGRYGVDFVWLEDVVRATNAALRSRATGVFNVGSGERKTIGDLARALAAHFGGPEPVIQPPGADAEQARGFAALDISRARRELGYIPTALTDGLERMQPSVRGNHS